MSDVRPLLFTLVDEKFAEYRSEKVRLLLEAGAEVNVRVKYSEYDFESPSVRYKSHWVGSKAKQQKRNSVLDREGVSVVERTRRLVWKYSKVYYGKNYRYGLNDRVVIPSEYKRVICEFKKHGRRHSV
jgi:hypothetical protein